MGENIFLDLQQAIKLLLMCATVALQLHMLLFCQGLPMLKLCPAVQLAVDSHAPAVHRVGM